MMRSAALLALFVALAAAQCNLSDRPNTVSAIRNGTFSSSGVFAVIQGRCGELSWPAPNLTVPAVFSSWGNADLSEQAISVSPYTMKGVYYFFLLVDGSGSQLSTLQQTISNINGNLIGKIKSFAGAQVAIAYFDGRDGIQMIKDWTDNIDSAFDALSNKFPSDYKPDDSASNYNGAVMAAAEYLNAKINKTNSFDVLSKGSLIVTGDRNDTTGSFSTEFITRFRSGYTSSSERWPATGQLRSYAQIWNNFNWISLTAPVGSVASSSLYSTSISANATSGDYDAAFNPLIRTWGNDTQNLYLFKACTAFRPPSTAYNNSGVLAERLRDSASGLIWRSIYYRTAQFTMGGTRGSFDFGIQGFSKGCNLDNNNYNVNFNSASSVSVSVLVAVLTVFALVF